MTVFVTGGSGFLGSHILVELLKQGYSVRAAARGTKAQELKTIYAKYGDKFEVVTVTDIATSQFPELLQGCEAVIHAASSMPGNASATEILDAAVEGTLNIVRQAEKVGIKRIVCTSSIFAAIGPKGLSDQEWAPITKEEAYANKTDGVAAYRDGKAVAEKELWTFADAHPNLDITTILPPFIYGPFAETFQCPTPNAATISTNLFVYRLIMSKGVWPFSARYADARDVAKAHVNALRSPLSSEAGVGRKRFLIGSVDGFNYPNFLQLIKEKRPQLASRLTTLPPPDVPQSGRAYPVDFARVEKILGIKKDEFHTFESTFLGTVDSLIEYENAWKAGGYEIDILPAPGGGRLL